MTDTQTAPETESVEDQTQRQTIALLETARDMLAAVQAIGGYAAQEEWGWVECDGKDIWAKLAPREGAEPLRIECRTDLLIGEVEAIPVAAGTPISEIWRVCAPYIRDWNIRARNTETNQWEAVPPPRVMGPDAFRYVKPLAAEWMAFVIKFARLRDLAHPKDDSPSSGTPSPPSEPASTSSGRASKSRRNRKGSTSSAPSA